MKIIQFQAMVSDMHGSKTLCLCDDGKIYIARWDALTQRHELKLYIEPVPSY
jgi:hypothetical protein